MANVMDEMNAVDGDDEDSRHILGDAAAEDVPEARDAGSVKKAKSSNLALYAGAGLVGLLILGKGYLMYFNKPSAPPDQNQFQALNVQPQPASMEPMPIPAGMPDPALQAGAQVDPSAMPGSSVDPMTGSSAPDPLQPQVTPSAPAGAQPVVAATAIVNAPQPQVVPGSPSTPVGAQAPVAPQPAAVTAPAPAAQIGTPTNAAPVQTQAAPVQSAPSTPAKAATKKIVKKRTSTKVASGKQDVCAVPDEYEPLSKDACDALRATSKTAKAAKKPSGSDEVIDDAYESGSKRWIVRMVVPGRAQLVSGSGDVLSVAIADAIPGAGKVTDIDAEEGVVKTSSGARFGFKTL